MEKTQLTTPPEAVALQTPHGDTGVSITEETKDVRIRGESIGKLESPCAVGSYAVEHPNDWVVGGSWDHESWGGELPRRDWIDSLTGDTLVDMTIVDGQIRFER